MELVLEEKQSAPAVPLGAVGLPSHSGRVVLTRGKGTLTSAVCQTGERDGTGLLKS